MEQYTASRQRMRRLLIYSVEHRIQSLDCLSIKPDGHGTVYISCHYHMGKDHCDRLWEPHSLVSALADSPLLLPAPTNLQAPHSHQTRRADNAHSRPEIAPAVARPHQSRHATVHARS